MTITLPKLTALPKRDSTARVARTQAERLWIIGGSLVGFVLVLIGYFFFISPQRSQTSSVDSQVASTQQQNAELKSRLDVLRQQNRNLAKYESELAQARLALPSTSGVSDFVRSLQALGAATQTDVTALSVGQPSPVTVVAAQAPPTTTSAPPSGTVAATPKPSAYSLAISVSVTGSPSALNQFLDQLQKVQPRAVLITQVAESAGQTGSGKSAAPTTTLQLSMNAFVVPAVPAATTSTPPAN